MIICQCIYCVFLLFLCDILCAFCMILSTSFFFIIGFQEKYHLRLVLCFPIVFLSFSGFNQLFVLIGCNDFLLKFIRLPECFLRWRCSIFVKLFVLKVDVKFMKIVVFFVVFSVFFGTFFPLLLGGFSCKM